MIYKTRRGELVRSKSELMIADFLYENGLAYIYEKPYYFMRSNGAVNIDFTVLNRHGEVFFWEHYGMMDDPDYVRDSFMFKIQRFARDGIIVGKDLIVSFESREAPLTPAHIKQLAEYYLL